MDYGPYQGDVHAFLESIGTLAESDWTEARMWIVRHVTELYPKLDKANLMLAVAQRGNPALRAMCDAAAAAAASAAAQLHWAEKSPELVRDVQQAAQAIVALETVEFDALVILFMPFRNTSVRVPVDWGT